MKVNFKSSRENRLYVIAIVIMTSLFTVFLSSKYWLYDDSAVAQTPYDKEISGLSETKVLLRSWEYNPDKKLMEVKLETDLRNSDDLNPSYEFEAMTKDKKREFKAENIYHDNDNVVVHIKGVPKDYEQVVLKIIERRDKREVNQFDNSESDELNDNSDNDQLNEQREQEKSTTSDVIVHGDYREITDNENLVEKTESQYKEESIKEEMTRVEEEMKSITGDSIPVKEEKIERLKDEKLKLERELSYQTDDEQTQTEKDIENKEEKIEATKDEISELKDDLEQIYDKYNKRKDKLEKLTKNQQQPKYDDVERKHMQREKFEEKHEEREKKKQAEKEKKEKEKAKKKKEKEKKKKKKEKDKDK